MEPPMGHYKSNLRDIEFNLFEVLRRQDLLGSEPYPELDEETARGILDEVNRLASGPRAAQLPRGRPPPAGIRPGDELGADARVVQEVVPGLDGRAVVPARRARSPGRWRSWCSAPTRRSGCTRAVRPSPAACGTSTRPSRSGSPSSPSSASGARRWC